MSHEQITKRNLFCVCLNRKTSTAHGEKAVNRAITDIRGPSFRAWLWSFVSIVVWRLSTGTIRTIRPGCLGPLITVTVVMWSEETHGHGDVYRYNRLGNLVRDSYFRMVGVIVWNASVSVRGRVVGAPNEE